MLESRAHTMIDVLLVEDEPDHAALVHDSWKVGCGWRIVEHVSSLPEATAALERVRFDLVLLDLNLRESRGVNTLRTLYATRLPPPIVVLTSLEDNTLAREAIRSGAADYIPKTELSPELLGRTIRHTIERNGLLRELKDTNRRLDEFAALAAHDLIAPLHGIVSVLDLLNGQHEPSAPEDSLDSLDMIRGECERLADLIRELLRFARVGRKSMRLEFTDLTELAQQVINGLSVATRTNNARIHLAELPSAHVDRDRFKLVLQNLIENGLKYQPDGNRPEIRVVGEQERDQVRIWVHDNGVGISTEHHTQIFKAFHRLHASRFPGSGLGLAHCTRIVHDHGGAIGVDSTPGQGSSFWFTIPIRDELHRAR